MEIRFTKRKEVKHVISCKRKDGSETWMNISSFFVLHDLCHFAVENNLKWKKAFYGMLASGTDINNFELPKEQRTFQLTDEAIQAEHLVNLFVIEYNQGRFENFRTTIENVYKQNGQNEEPPVLSDETIEEIRNSFEGLVTQWNGIEEGNTMSLIFEE